MGLLDGFARLMQGKPVFEDTASQPPAAEAQRTVQRQESSLRDAKGQKIIPTISVTKCRASVRGTAMDVTAWVTNTSQVAIELDKVVIMDVKTELDRHLSPGEGRQLVLYRGPLAATDHLHRAHIDYKVVENGDYFQAEYNVEYNRESSGLFTIEEFHPERDVRDI